MDRREAIKKTTLLMGYSLTASALLAALEGCKEETGGATTPVLSESDDWKPAFLSQDQVDLVAELGETIIPETDTPGAKTAAVHRYIDDELQYMLATDEQYTFLKGLEDVQIRAERGFGKRYQEGTYKERLQVLAEMEKEEGHGFFRQLKVLVCGGYFTSEIVCKEVLKYDPIPGQYEGCIDIDRSTPVWSL